MHPLRIKRRCRPMRSRPDFALKLIILDVAGNVEQVQSKSDNIGSMSYTNEDSLAGRHDNGRSMILRNQRSSSNDGDDVSVSGQGVATLVRMHPRIPSSTKAFSSMYSAPLAPRGTFRIPLLEKWSSGLLDFAHSARRPPCATLHPSKRPHQTE
jgi:hypothetical protein